MKNGNKEFLNLLCNLYAAAMLTALPLYTGQGYWQLGNTKYILFRNITVLCLGCWLIMGMPGRLRAMIGRERGRKVFGMTDRAVAAYGAAVLLSAVASSYGQLAWRGYEGWFTGAFFQLLLVGIYFFVSRQYDGSGWPLYVGEAALAAVTVLGLLHRLGIDPLGLMEGWNSGDWEYSHMLSTLGNINWLCGYYSAALALLVNHFLQEERKGLRFVLYIASVLAFVLLGIQGSQGGLLILAVCVLVCLVCGVLEGRPTVLKRVSLLTAGFCLCMPMMWQLMRMRGKKAAIVLDGNVFEAVEWYVWELGAAVCILFYFLVDKRRGGRKENSDFCMGKSRFMEKSGAMEENRSMEKGRPVEEDRSIEIRSNKGMLNGRRYIGHRETAGIREDIHQESKRGKGLAVAGCAAAFCITAAGIAVFCLASRHVDDGFGSGRGLLWRIAVESFEKADWKDKLLGAGPDCYAEAVFAGLGTGTEVWNGDHWEGAVFTNAHNELLSQLCNVGILGTVSYVAIFLTAFWQYDRERRMILRSRKCSVQRQIGRTAGRRRDDRIAGEDRERRDDRIAGMGQFGRLGLLAAAMYGAHSLISFQQVLNTPLLFIILGLCEAQRRNFTA